MFLLRGNCGGRDLSQAEPPAPPNLSDLPRGSMGKV
jgi:hypothetical protein